MRRSPAPDSRADPRRGPAPQAAPGRVLHGVRVVPGRRALERPSGVHAPAAGHARPRCQRPHPRRRARCRLMPLVTVVIGVRGLPALRVATIAASRGDAGREPRRQRALGVGLLLLVTRWRVARADAARASRPRTGSPSAGRGVPRAAPAPPRSRRAAPRRSRTRRTRRHRARVRPTTRTPSCANCSRRRSTRSLRPRFRSTVAELALA